MRLSAMLRTARFVARIITKPHEFVGMPLRRYVVASDREMRQAGSEQGESEQEGKPTPRARRLKVRAILA